MARWSSVWKLPRGRCWERVIGQHPGRNELEASTRMPACCIGLLHVCLPAGWCVAAGHAAGGPEQDGGPQNPAAVW
eukprot:208384-Chlamydomonas_euryale.AAC.3